MIDFKGLLFEGFHIQIQQFGRLKGQIRQQYREIIQNKSLQGNTGNPKIYGLNHVHYSQQFIQSKVMNFDRIQKIRSQRTIEASKPLQINPQIKSKQVFQTNSKKQSISGKIDIKSIQYDKPSIRSTQNHSKSATLRDFLHLTSKDSVKQSPTKKVKRTSVEYKKTQPLRSNSQQRKRTLVPNEKQQASKKEIFEIVKKDINRDLIHIKEVAQALQGKFQNDIQCLRLNNAQMIEIYNFRKRVRQNIVKEMNCLDDLIGNIICSQRKTQENGNMPVIFEEQEERTLEIPTSLQKDYQICYEREQPMGRMQQFQY